MKRFIPIFLCLILGFLGVDAQERFLDEVFDEVSITENVPYAGNITIVTGTISLDTLLADFYMPEGDTMSERPLVIVLHTGTFIPKGLLSTTGYKDDYTVVETCTRLAKMGYVAAAIEYRLGWNVTSTQELERRATIIQAAYRAVQDLHTFVRFANATVLGLGNPYRINTNKIATYGIGTGGFVNVNAAIIDDLEETNIRKFQNPVNGQFFINRQMFGGVTGEDPGILVVGQDTFPFNIPNHVGFSSDFHFCFAADGGVGDSTWLEGDKKIPIVLAGVVSHPTTPFGVDVNGNTVCDTMVRNGLTGDPILPICPTKCTAVKANELGQNDVLNDPNPTMRFDDEISNILRGQEHAEEHLWAIRLPGAQAGPWSYWDSTFWKTVPFPPIPGVSLHDIEKQTNPDMSMDKANRYIDTLLAFFAPRACVALGLLPDIHIGVSDIDPVEVGMNIIPNPAQDYVIVSVDEDEVIDKLVITGLDGRTVVNYEVDGSTSKVLTDDWAKGLYIVNAVTNKGIASMRLIIE